MPKLRLSLSCALIFCGLALLIGTNLMHLFKGIESASFYQSGQWLLFSQSLAPRFFVAILAGASLGLCGWLAQLVLKNPLAEPATLGIASGAQLGVTLAIFVGGSALLTQGAALCGGLISTSIIYLLSRRRGMAPLTLLLTGMVIGLFCSALQNGLVLFNHEQMQSLFIWNSGNLAQNDWSVVSHLLPMLLIICLGVVVSARALNLLRLSDDVVDSMGGNSRGYRLFALCLMALLASWTVSQVGIVSFIGLFAPQIVRLFPRYSFTKQLISVMVFGSLILLLCDQVAIAIERFHWQVSAGNLTAIIGIPLMLWIIVRARFVHLPHLSHRRYRLPRLPRVIIPLLLIGVVLVIALGMGLTRSAQGDLIFSLNDPYQLRWPRCLIAVGCGGLLASAGVILQRLTSNPLASPEVLGINSGAACAVVLALIIAPAAGGLILFPAAAAGALISLLLIMFFAVKTRSQSSSKILLVGTTLSAFSLALITLFLATGAPNSGIIISWLSGSTWGATGASAKLAMASLLVSLPISLLFTRWLTVLPLGKAVASSLGVSIRLSTVTLIIWCAVLSAGATLLLGPMSFVGLLAPQAVRFLGLRRYPAILLGSVILGGLLMLGADIIGRIIIWPFQIPAGIVAVLVGAPGLLWLLTKQD